MEETHKTKTDVLERVMKRLSETDEIMLAKRKDYYCKETFQISEQHHPVHTVVIPVIFRKTPCELGALNTKLRSLVPEDIGFHTLEKFVAYPVEINGWNCAAIRTGYFQVHEKIGEYRTSTTAEISDTKLAMKLGLGESSQTIPLNHAGDLTREIKVIPYISMAHFKRRARSLDQYADSEHMDMNEWCSYGGKYMSSDMHGKIRIGSLL